MAMRGSSRGYSRGGAPRGRGGYASRGRGSSSYGGPPEAMLPIGAFLHQCEHDIVCESINEKIPHVTAPIFLENKTPIGKIDEVFGPINKVYFSVKPQDGILAERFSKGDKFFIDSRRLMPLERLLPQPKPLLLGPKIKNKKVDGQPRGGSMWGRPGRRGGARGGMQRGGQGGRGGPRGGRGGPGNGRGGSSGRGGFSRGGRGGAGRSRG